MGIGAGPVQKASGRRRRRTGRVMSDQSCDVVVIGGAAMGSSVAWHLAGLMGEGARILVIERDPTYAHSASALSAASIRQQFSSPVNIRISLHGIAFMRAVGEHLKVGEDRPRIDLREGGYLYLASPAGAGLLAELNALQRAEGADIVLMDEDGLSGRFPWLSLDGVAAGSWGRTGEGWYDGWALLQAFRKAARARGVAYRQDAVTGLERDGNRIAAVRTASGERIACGAVVNCAGSGGRAIAAMAGIDIPVHAKRRFVFSFTCPDRLDGMPLLIDLSGAYVRPEGEGFICGISPPAEADPDWDDADPDANVVDWSLFEETIWPALAGRIPAFERIRPGRAWAGPYDMNLFDHNAIVGPAPAVENLHLCNGFSGHGLQQCPAVGRGLAELIALGRYDSLDLSDLGYERIPAGRPLLERNVI